MKRSLIVGILSVAIGAAVVLPSLHVAFRPAEPPTMAREIARQQLAEWQAGQRDVARSVNPEWDLGHHTFFAMALANLALTAPPAERASYRAAVDAVLDEMRARPPAHYHLAYFHGGPFRDPEARSLFLEGEILLVLAARLAVWPEHTKNAELTMRAERVVQSMGRGPTVMAESYPDECWMFDNTLALAALAVTRHVLGYPVAGAEELTRRWLASAPRLVDPHTGLLVSSSTWDGKTLDGPEGSSAFAVAHFLQLVDEPLARDQYERAKRHLVVRPLGFAFAREWPDARLWGNDPLPPRAEKPDVDSGPVIPLVRAGAGASGMAILGASAFGDQPLVTELATSLELAAFPERAGGGLKYLASNGLGDAVLLYALAQGPLFRLIRTGTVGS
jgi:hypothetical protein